MQGRNKRLESLELSAQKLARQMVDREGLRVVVAGTACCWAPETDTLHLPSYSTDNPVDEDLTSEDRQTLLDAWRGLIDHEMSHAVHTDAAIWIAAKGRWKLTDGMDANKMWSLAHVFEDPFVECVWMDKYAGAARYIPLMNKYIIEKSGGAACTWPEHKGIGVFGAFVQAILRRPFIDDADISPQIMGLLDACQDILDTFNPRLGTEHNIELTEQLWQRLQDLGEAGDDDGTGEGGRYRLTEDEGAGAGESSKSADSDSDGGASSDADAGTDAGTDADEDSGHGGGGCSFGDSGDSSDSGGDGDSEASSSASEPKESGADASGKVGAAAPREVVKDAAKAATGGEWGEIASADEILSGEFVGKNDPMRAPWSVHPSALAGDKWVTYNAEDRKAVREHAQLLRESIATESSYLAARLRRVIIAQRRDLLVGAQEDGETLDIDSLPYLATRLDSQRVWTQRFRAPAQNTFVTVVVDCSGSMGTNKMITKCPHHGEVKQSGKRCTRERHGKRCNIALTRTICSKAGYAAMTAMALHDSLRLVKVPHCVLGYTTIYSHYDGPNTDNDEQSHGFKHWSRDQGNSIATHEFVSARACLTDKGDALPYITGQGANADGDSIREAAKYALRHAEPDARIIMIVIADGMPAGCSDSELEGPYLKRSVQDLKATGIEVYGVGVGIRDRKTFSDYYPESVVIRSGEGLGKEVINGLLSMMTRSNGRAR